MIPLPAHTIITKTDTSISLTFSLPDDLVYFDGHFPQVPILPGVAQLAIAKQAAEHHLGVTADVTKLSKVKFTNIMTANRGIQLNINITNNTLQFTYRENGDSRSSGTMHLNA